jgi:hypothetical protein
MLNSKYLVVTIPLPELKPYALKRSAAEEGVNPGLHEIPETVTLGFETLPALKGFVEEGLEPVIGFAQMVGETTT